MYIQIHHTGSFGEGKFKKKLKNLFLPRGSAKPAGSFFTRSVESACVWCDLHGTVLCYGCNEGIASLWVLRLSWPCYYRVEPNCFWGCLAFPLMWWIYPKPNFPALFFVLSAHVGHHFLPYVCFPPYTLGCISKLSFQVISMFAGIRSRRGWSSAVLRAIIFGWRTSELGVGIGVGVVVIGLGVVRELEWSRS